MTSGATGGDMPIWLYLVTIGLILGTVLLVFGMKYFSAVFQARVRIADNASYRALAEKTLAVQSANQSALQAIQADLSKSAASLAAVEKILHEVE